jgi:hypothetical protein
MRRYLLTLAAVGWFGILGVPVFATGTTDGETDVVVAVPDTAVEVTGIRDEAMMVLVGSVLIGVAAAVRRTA